MSDWQEHLVVRRCHPLAATAKTPDTLTFALALSSVTVRNLDPGVHAALLAVDTESISLAELTRIARAVCRDTDTTRLLRELGRLYVRKGLAFAVEHGTETLCTLWSTSSLGTATLDLAEAGHRYRMSRFAVLRREDSDLVVDSLAGHARLSIQRTELAAALAGLHRPATEPDLAASLAAALPPEVLGACLRLMVLGGVVGIVDEDGKLPEDRDPDLDLRDPHDLLLHNRSRIGLTTDPVGGTYRMAGTRPPLPALRAAWSGARTALPRPDLDALTRTDMPLTAVMERRRSRRRFAPVPLSLDELGEFLFRVFRVKQMLPLDPDEPHSYEGSLRPLPSAGDAHDLEVYVVAGRIDGLGRGLFHYDPLEHTVAEVAGPGYPVSALLGTAKLSAAIPEEPPALIVLASRFGRLAWKYEGLSYAATLKNVGVAYAGMYLAAEAMGLAACGLGSGDAGSFGAATGVKPYVESSVGELMLGPAAVAEP
ncbi:SagB family peptide dehydrogenase [Labedaea rhizosphaerae]|uniref:SagB family peptide dehydrogenase n=1 Tax=Labedaea rhizosphaerae TaxID=598644 RepID=UPI00105E2F7B|nr:SagB family peptide dehydrogenase [Labedaea rhizosphaerae]